MSSRVPHPPYRWALAVAGIVLVGLLPSLAPSVTFWDSGEFIAAMKILGIPHPPGTPLFVMMGHVFAGLVPIGEYAFRTNLQSALFAAAGAGFWVLVLHEAAGRYLGGEAGRGAAALRIAAATAGAVITAFGFSNWLNSNETEVYTIATFTIAVNCWLMLRWRAARGTDRSVRYLVLCAFLIGLAIGNHLLGLLAGPAIVAFMIAELWQRPMADPAVRRRELAETVLMGAIWGLLLGLGLGSEVLVALGGGLFLAALVYAGMNRRLGFGLVLLPVALVGVTPYLFLFLRAAQHPIINEADPSTWPALLDVIRRAQYEFRTPFQDPTFRYDDPANPGRGLRIIALQIANYIQYFDWQFAKGLSRTIAGLPLRVLFTLLFLVLGVRGFRAQWQSDRSGAWLLLVLFVATGIGLMGYMNFKPGYSIGYNWYPDTDQHEVRERDYFFVGSFIVWGLWAGLGLLTVARRSALGARRLLGSATDSAPGTKLPSAENRVPSPERRAPSHLFSYALFLLALLPYVLNFRAADRRWGSDAQLPGDFAYDLLNSVPPYGILFTYGDNDTFPLWWAQEVAGVRRDVTVVCLALAQTEWYMRQVRDMPVRPFDPVGTPAIWQGYPASPPTWPLHTMTDGEIAAALPQILPQDVTLPIAQHRITLPARTVLSSNDFLSLRVIQQNFGRRPIAWALTAAGQTYGMDRFLVQRGLVIALESDPVDTTRLEYDRRYMLGMPLDVPMTERLMEETYRYAGLLSGPRRELESTASGIANTLSLPYTQLAFAMDDRGDPVKAVKYLERSLQLTRNPALTARLDSLRSGLPPSQQLPGR